MLALVLVLLKAVTEMAWASRTTRLLLLLWHVSLGITSQVRIEVGLVWSWSLLILSIVRSLWGGDTGFWTIDGWLRGFQVRWRSSDRWTRRLGLVSVLLRSVHNGLLLVLVLCQYRNQI